MKSIYVLCIVITLHSGSIAQSLERHYAHKFAINQPLSSQIANQAEVDLLEVFLEIEADNLSTKIDATATLTASILGTTYNEFTLELVDQLQVQSVIIDNQSVSFSHYNDLLTITRGVNNNSDTIQIKIKYKGIPNPASDGIFTGINSKVSNAWGHQITYTLSQPFNAKSWWPAKQDLTDKINRTQIHVTTTKNLKVGANGVLKKTVLLLNNKVRYEWESNYPIAYYLIGIAIGDYIEYNNYAKPNGLNGDSILIQNYLYNSPDILTSFQENLDRIPEMISLFSNLFGTYPFHEEKYGHMMAPIGGGMEHQTMSTMSTFAFGLDAHELGHQWFGDLVTCATWKDIWINEGFARFCEYIATEKLLREKDALELIQKDIESVISIKDGSTYISDEDLSDSRIFQFRLSYQKGGLILHMLRNIVKDDEKFFTGVKSYLNEFRNGTATGEDFKMILARETGLDFDGFFEQWYHGAGYPIFDIDWTRLEGDSLGIRIQQTTSDDVALFTTPLAFKITFQSGQVKNFRLQQTQNDEYFKVAANGKVASLRFDPNDWLVKNWMHLTKWMKMEFPF